MTKLYIFAETQAEFWRDLKVVLSSDSQLTDRLLSSYSLMQYTEVLVVSYQLRGENKTNMLHYLVKMNVKYYPYIRKNFEQFLRSYSGYDQLYKKWIELRK